MSSVATEALPARRAYHDHIVDTLIAERAPKLSGGVAWPLLRPLLYRLLDYRKARSMADAIAPMGGREALDYVSRLLDVKVSARGLDRVPRTGRLVLICNHPTGIADGVAVYDALRALRPDVCFYANSDAHRVSEAFGEVLIPVEWREEKRTRERTRNTLNLTREVLEQDRILRDEDFRDDKKDAGDMGAGHSVTALYEVVPVGVRGTVKARESDPLRYAVEPGDGTTRAAEGDELLHVSLRYKKPGESSSRLITKALRSRDLQERVSDDLRFAASVASFGMLLRDSEYKGTATAGSVLTLARGAMGEDDDGYRAEFVQLVERWRGMARGVADRPVRRDR